MYAIYIVCAAALVISFIADRRKTLKALRIALKKILNILPAFGLMLVIVSAVLYFLPQDVIARQLDSGSSIRNIGIAAVLGSVAMLPGFIAFPLCGLLRDSGVSWAVIGAFSTSLMLVGVISFPVEKHYLGTKTALLRNCIALLMSIIIALLIGLLYGEFLS